MVIYYVPRGGGTGSSGPSADEIADAVWNRTMADFTNGNTFGGFVKKLLTVGKFLGLK